MSEWIVYKKGGQSELCRIKSLQYDGSWMGECSITATIKSATPLSFSIGDYLEYRGERFEINYDPTVIKSATSGTYGEGFVYDNVKFNSLSDELTRCDFLDYVPDDNLIHYSSLPTFGFFADNISKLAERIQVNLDRVYTGEKKWTVEVHPEYVNKENVNISVSNQTCWDALALVKSEFDANFIIKNRTIIIGTEGIAVGKVFSYGKSNGLVTIERNAETDQKIVTRLRAYGSTKNLPFRYYARIGEGVIPNNMAIQNLMLPGFPDATTDPYIDSPNIDELGVREGTVFFDGSNGLPEIFPSMENMTAEELKGAGVSVNATGRLDEVVSAEQITDNGIFEPSEGETEVTIPTFTVTLKDIGFNINDYLSSAGTATLSMKDGMCGGRDFEIVGCEKTDDGYVLTCNRSEDTSLGLFFPYNDYNIQSGDKFVLLNIEMPDVYIQTASQRLYDAARDWLYKNDYVRYSYTPKVDNVFMARQHDASLTNNDASIHDTIKEGDLMLFEDTDLNIEGSVIIDTLSIKEGESAIPQYEITLRNDKTVGTIQKIQNQIDSIVSGKTGVNAEGGYNASQIKSLIKAFGSTFFLRKDQDDRSKGKIASDVALEVGKFVTGASGAIIQVDKTTGQTVAELDKLYVRMKAYFETLEIINVNSVGGRMILSPAGSVTCIGVEETDDAYRCYFLGEQDGEVIENRFESGDQAYSEMFNAKTGVTNKVSNHYYWRLVTFATENVVDYNNKKCHYIELSKTDCDANSDIPKVGDVICHRGSRTDTDRMNFIEFSSVGVNAPYITLFQGVGGTTPYYSLTNKEYVSYGYDQSTGRAYMNVYGDMYVGDRNQTSYIRYTPENGLEVKGKLSVGTTLGGKDLQEMIDSASPEGYQEFVDKVTQDIEGLQNQIDGAIDSYFFQYDPSLTNYPASEWDTENEKIAHLNDTFTNIASDSGRSWRWVKDPNTGVYSWTEITDTATTQALALAGQAQDTADGKRRVFTSTPTTPYNVGDLWAGGSEVPLKRCIVERLTGTYDANDWDYADNTEKVKQEMQSLVETTKGDLNNAIGQANEAIGKLDESLTQAKTDLQGALNELNDAKDDIDSIYDWAAKDGEFTDIEKVALDAAVVQSNAAVEYYDTLVKAYADGTISEEEKEKIQGAKASLDAAKKYADQKAQEALSEIRNSYLFQALTEAPSTEVTNGLILSSLIQLRDSDSNVMSGINGLIDASKGDKSIANWWGGIMGDMTDYYTWNGREWVAKSGVTIPSNLPSGLIRMDGTGYLAKGKFWWDEDGKIYADPTALFLSFDVDDPAVSFSATILDIKDKQAEFADMWEVKTDENGTEYLFAKRNIVTQGGLTSYADTTDLDIPSIFDSLPIASSSVRGVAQFSSNYFEVNNGLVTIKEDSVGLNEDELTTWLANSDYATKTYVSDNYATKSSLNTINATLVTKWTQDNAKISNWDTAYNWGNHASAGYFLAENFTKSNIKSKLGISDWALESTKPSYTTKEVTEDTNLYFTEQRAIDALEDTLKAYVTLKGTQTIEGEKDFTGGLKVNGSPIVYDIENKYWKFQGNLLVTGGITSYYDDGSLDLPSIYDGLPIDGTTIYWDGDVLKAKVAEGGITSITKDMVIDALDYTPYDASNPNGYITSSALNGYATQTWVNQQGFLTEHQDLSAYLTKTSASSTYQTKITSSNLLSYYLLSNTPDLSVYATQTWVEDKGYLTAHQSLDGYVNEITTNGTGNAVTSISKSGKKLTFTKGATYLTTTVANGLYHPLITESAKLPTSKISGLATVATSGSYNDLSNKPTIPTSLKSPYALSWSGYSSGSYDGSAAKSITIPSNTNQLTNGAGFITSSVSGSINLNGDWENDFGINFNEGGGATYGFSLLYGADDLFKFVTRANSTTNTTIFSVTRGSSVLNFANTPTVNGSSVWHSGNFTPSNYLPLSGGTITNNSNSFPLILDSSSGNETSICFHRSGTRKAVVGYYDGTGAFLWNSIAGSRLSLSDGDGLTFAPDGNNIYTIWHSGNFTPSNYLPLSGGTITGNLFLKNTYFMWQETTNNYGGYFTGRGFNAHTNQTYTAQIFTWDTNGILTFKSTPKVGSNTLALLTDNVASATKLQTARTIWGHSFDGTGNVNGSIVMDNGNNKIFWHGDANNYMINCPVFGGSARLEYKAYEGHGFYAAGSEAVTIKLSGNVGVGTTSPEAKLHVNGCIYANNGTSSVPSFRWNKSGTYWGGIGYNGISNYNEFGSCYQNTWVDADIDTWRFRGNIIATGGITQYSDIRKKTKLQDVELTLKQIADAPLIEHYYKHDDKKTTHVGSIAQYWAGMNDWFCKLDNEGYYTMEIQNAALASAISIARELVKYESKTDRTIRLLKKRINQLEDEIENLKKGA